MKWFALLGLILFLGVAIGSHTNAMKIEQQSRGNIITVDDEGDGDYTSIKTAVANANPGDTIEVYSGTYEDHDIGVETENVRLQGIPYELGNGTDTGRPFIEGRGLDETLEIYAPNVTVDGFHIENEGLHGNVVLGLYPEADGCIISNNTVSNCSGSLIWIDGSKTKILNNDISHSLASRGIVLSEPSNYNIVKGNKISDCATGILTWGSGDNLIEGNIVSNCEDFGMDIGYYDNIVRYNNIKDNFIGLQLMSVGSIVSNNNFVFNEHHATFYYGRFFWIYSNRWSDNYWGRPRVLPYSILGQVVLLPWMQFDWRPVLLPNQIN